MNDDVSISSDAQKDEHQKNDELKEKDGPEFAHAALLDQVLHLALNSHHVLLSSVDVVVQLVQHFVLQSRLRAEVLRLESGGLNNTKDIVKLLVRRFDMSFLLLKKLLISLAFS